MLIFICYKLKSHLLTFSFSLSLPYSGFVLIDTLYALSIQILSYLWWAESQEGGKTRCLLQPYLKYDIMIKKSWMIIYRLYNYIIHVYLLYTKYKPRYLQRNMFFLRILVCIWHILAQKIQSQPLKSKPIKVLHIQT